MIFFLSLRILTRIQIIIKLGFGESIRLVTISTLKINQTRRREKNSAVTAND